MRRIQPMEGKVAHWLGLGFAPPEGLHGDKRRRITLRYTTLGNTRARQGISFDRALAMQYNRSREHAVMRLLRPKQLDDKLWRTIYAVMVAGNPLKIAPLASFLERISSDDLAVAEAEAVKRYRAWIRLTRRMEGSDAE